MLTPTKQQEKIIQEAGNLVVIAKPGSGKTYVISQKVRQILSDHVPFKGVIAISYTNKASNELKNRVLQKNTDPKGSFFGTIDRFSLSEIVIPFSKHIFGLPSNELRVIKLRDADDDSQIFYDYYYDGTKVGIVDDKLIAQLKNDYVSGVIYLEFVGVLSNHIIDHSIACKRYLRVRYTHVFIDEYQDSGEDQHNIFLKLIKLGIIGIAVGDVDQSIYAFSGKNSKYLLALAKDPTFKFLPLTLNHRSHPSIVNYSSFFISTAADLLDANEIRVFEKVAAGDERAIATWIDSIVDEVMATFKSDNYKNVGILVRSDRTGQLIHSSLTSPHRYFTSTEIDSDVSRWSEFLARILHFMFDPNVTRNEVIEDVYDPTKNKTEFKALCHKLTLLRNLSHDVSTNVLQILEIAEICTRIVLPKSVSSKSLKLFRDVISSSELIRNYVPAGKDEIQVMTLHKSKGLEFDIVFHLDLYEWIMPAKIIEDNKAVHTNIEQDANLHYVGITRARKACFLCRSTQRHNFQNQIKAGNTSEFMALSRVKSLREKSPW